MKLSLAALLFAPAAVLAAGISRTLPPSPSCIVVSKNATSWQFRTIQAAVNSLSTTASAAQCIFINPGTYGEQVLVPARAAQLSIYGYTNDTRGYAGNRVTITSSLSQLSTGLGNDAIATLRIKANGAKVYNLNINNGYGKGSQAVALSAYADSGYYGCQMTGYQDTVLANTGKQVYGKCLIQGVTDFIFGQTAVAWFQKCDIRVLASSIGYITGTYLSSAFVVF
jgi:pectinesterase